MSLEVDRTIPVRFDYDEQSRSLLVEWRDEVTQRIAFEVLRRNCPCATCQGEPGLVGRFQRDAALGPGESELADIQLVGAYGLNAAWADGHNTGIYTFERLRRLGDDASG